MGSIVLGSDVRIPASVVDLESFRLWARSPAFPERGSFSHLCGDLWVDLSMERLIHNQIKGEIARVLGNIVKEAELGLYLGDRMLLSNLDAELSTGPDGMFLSDQSMESGRARLGEGDDSLEVVGSPDMVLEVVSPTSVEKDTVLLRRLYGTADVSEYWLVDSREEEPTIDILRRAGARLVPVRRLGGWTRSTVFARHFRLSRCELRAGVSQFSLEVR